MTSATRGTGVPIRRPWRPAKVWHHVAADVRRVVLSSQVIATSVLVLCAALVGAGVFVARDWFPPALLIVVMLLATFVLRMIGMSIVVMTISVLYGLLVATGSTFTRGTLVVYALAAAAALVFVRSRERVGLQGIPSDLMLVDLRDRLAAHGKVPALPAGWRVESAIRPAHGEAFSGDFMVAARSNGGTMLELVLVDVSGKGQAAGVRSLQLSGALGGLLGAMPHREFLPAANAYLLRQGWDEGFATAIHLAVFLSTGEYWVSSAGHLPPVHLHAGSGRLELLSGRGGPALGLIVAPEFPVRRGRLAPDDAMMMYTDGIVETPGTDLELGIDRFMGVAERLVGTRSGSAEAVLKALSAGDGDDRALVFLHRS